MGKTTLTVNLASAIAETGATVLLVDSDPQCNLTSYLVEESVVNDLLDHSDGADGQTLWSALKPVVEGIGDVKTVTAIGTAGNVFLVPGDIRMAEFERELDQYWRECFQRKVKGFRGITALSRLVESIAAATHSQIIFYDTGPNIGPLNRTILLDCDYFIVPAACDLFSVRAIKTLGHALAEWLTDWQTIVELAPNESPLLQGTPRLLGYVPQQFRVYARGPATEYAKFLPQLEKGVQENLLTVLGRVDPRLVEKATSPLTLGLIQHFGSLASSAQSTGVPLWQSAAGTDGQRAEAHKSYADLADVVLRRTGLKS